MTQTMPNPDAALKDFFKRNEIFAALFNAYFFDNANVILADELEEADTAYTALVKVEEKNDRFKVEKINKYRDIIRRISKGFLVILAIEDQAKVHYSMPVRKMLYDVLGYTTELKLDGEVKDRKEWTTEEILSKIKKGTKITPIITIVFYTGDKPWDGPRCLHDMMDIDERLIPYVPDYPLYVVDIGHDRDISFNQKDLQELQSVLSSIYDKSAFSNEEIFQASTLALSSILTGDINMYRKTIENDKEPQRLCDTLRERDEMIRAEFKDKFEEQEARLEEQETRLEEQEAQIRKYQELLKANGIPLE